MAKRFKGFHHLPVWGNRPRLTITRILASADAHHAATGNWPGTTSGPVRKAPFSENWAAINTALRQGFRTLPGGQSLAGLLQEHRGVEPRLSDEGKRSRTKRIGQLLAERRRCKGRVSLSVERILAWADAYHAATGRWPSACSGRIRGVPGETWCTINRALFLGRPGLPAGSSLSRLLAQYGRRKIQTGTKGPDLTIDQILAWADSYHAAHGRWPIPGPAAAAEAPGTSWDVIDRALRRGSGALRGGSSLARLLAERRGARNPAALPPLRIDQILAWADSYRAANGYWPAADPVAVAEAPQELWRRIDRALRQGDRGLPGGSSLPRLLAKHRGARNHRALPPLRVDQILAWADAYHVETQKWPSRYSGQVRGAPGEQWSSIDAALTGGDRGLPGGSSLPRLLAEHRPVRRKVLTVEMIRDWAEAHRQAHGRWPSATTGPVDGLPGEDWGAIDTALSQGRRGLPGGTTLARLLGRSVDPTLVGPRPTLTVEQVLAWGEAHRAATGRWPSCNSGAVSGAPGEKWVNINVALTTGRRGLPSGTSLAQLFAARAEDPHSNRHRPKLTLDQVLAWGDAHYRATGRWPAIQSGAIPGAPSEKWVNINQALNVGCRGLPSGGSLAKLFAGRPAPDGVDQNGRRRLSRPA